MSKENLINKISQLPDSTVKVSGKINSSDIKEILTENAQGYSENDLTDELKEKLEGIENGANNYVHPATHDIGEVSGLDTALANKRDIPDNKNINLPIGTSGWYTIATCSNGRAIGRFGVKDTMSGRHQTCVFYASHLFGDGNSINIIANALRYYNPIEEIRIKDKSSSDGAALQIYINTDDRPCTLNTYLLGDNFQSRGWKLIDLTEDSIVPEGISSEEWAGYHVSAGDIKLLIGNGSVNTSGDIYAQNKKLATEEFVNSNLDTKVDKENGKGLSTIDLTIDLKDELASSVSTVTGGEGLGQVTTLNPIDGVLSLTGGHTGSVKITLPQGYSDTMMKLEVDIFHYTMDKSVKVYLSGYNYTNGFWANTSVQIIGSEDTLNYPVRFGHDGEKCCIYIGELNTSWHYPKVIVSKGMFGFRNVDSSKWLKGWDVSLETSEFKSVTKHHTDNLIRKITESERNKLAGINVERLITGNRDTGINSWDGDVFDVNKSGFYYATSIALNRPEDKNGFFVVEAFSEDNINITYTNHNGSGTFTNQKVNGVWKQWERNEVLTPELKEKLEDLSEISILDNGKVGIGTTTPSTKFTIAGLGEYDGLTLGDHLKLRTSSAASDSFVIEHSKTNGNLYIRSRSTTGQNGSLALNDNGGNVGVGASAPKEKLHVNGGRLRVETPTGYATFGSDNGSFFHMTTDRPLFYFNTDTTVNGDIKLYNIDTYLRKSDGAVIQNGEKVATENQVGLKLDKQGLVSSSGRAYTPVNTSGWFKLASINRGAGIINVSFIGGDHQPVTFCIKYFKDWSSTGYLALERYGTADYLQEVRIIQDSDDIYYLEVLCKTHTKGLKMDVYDQPILGLNSTDVFVGNLQPGASSGTPIAHAYFVNGVSHEGNQHIAGNLGVGEHKPSEKLEVFDSNTKPGVISLKSYRNDAEFVDVGQIVAKQGSTEVARINMTRAGGTYTGFMSFWTKEDNTAPLVESMRISHDGKVGIGTTDPGQGNAPDPNRKLMVDGGISVSKGSRISYDPDYLVHAYTEYDNSYAEARFKNFGHYGYRWDTRNGIQMVLLGNNGNLGIGTRTPTEDVSIYNNSARLSVTGPSGSSAILLGNQDSMGVNTPAVVQGANGHLYLGKGTSWNRGGTLTSTLQVNSNGKVGIGTGTDTPQQKLHVKGGKARFETEYGYVDLGAENSTWLHVKTDQQMFYLNKETHVDGDIRVYNTNTYLRKSDGAIFENNSRVATKNYVDQSQQTLRNDVDSIEQNIDRDRIVQMVIDSSRDELQVVSNAGKVLAGISLEDLRRELLK